MSETETPKVISLHSRQPFNPESSPASEEPQIDDLSIAMIDAIKEQVLAGKIRHVHISAIATEDCTPIGAWPQRSFYDCTDIAVLNLAFDIQKDRMMDIIQNSRIGDPEDLSS